MKQLSKKKVKERRKVGIVKAYISRAAAIKKLQVPLSDFRRLCILKGIYPVEPKNKSKLSGGNVRRKTYFFTRDIQYLINDPLVLKFWEFKVFMKRLTKAKGRHNFEKFQQVNENKPIYQLDGVVKERYPRFIDALRDCDDALNMCFLFAMFHKDRSRPDDLVDLSKQMTSEFLQYVIQSKSLRKVFISIKGYYYQAEIMGQTITWMVPHQFVIDRVSDVDINVMKTFTEFYITLLGFINYKLSKTLSASESIDDKEQQPDIFEDIEEPEKEKVQQVIALERLFKGLKFFLNREVPRESLTFIIKSFGGEVSWDKESFPDATYGESDPSITHHIVDRDNIAERRLNRVYIQPQWVYDSVNVRALLPTADYLIGAKLPPHLSPFVEEKRGEYVPPDKLKTINLLKQFAAEKASEEKVNKGEGGVESELETDTEFEKEAESESDKEDVPAKKKLKATEDDKNDLDSYDSKKSRTRIRNNKMKVTKGKLQKVEDKEELKKQEDAEHRKMGIMMIPKKKKRLFDRITKTQRQKNKKTEKMKAKRRIVDAVSARQKSDKKFAHKTKGR